MGPAIESNSSEKSPPSPWLTVGDLERAIAEVDGGALLLPARILRRVIKEEHRLPRLRLNLPHGTSYTIAKARLLEIVDRSELDDEVVDRLPEEVILLPQPDPEELDFTPAADLLTCYWRWLFHAHVHLRLQGELAGIQGDSVLLRHWLRRLGMSEFSEVRTVLAHEERLFPEADDWAVLIEFIATYLELQYFAPSTLEHYFPGLREAGASKGADSVAGGSGVGTGRSDVEDLLREWVDADQLFMETRLGGAKLPGGGVPPADDTPSIFLGLMELQTIRQSQRQSPRYCRRLVARAERAAARGNLVRACILVQRARKYAAETDHHRLRANLRGHLVRLVGALQQALRLPDTEIDAWRDALMALVARGAVGIRSREARLLFDLQKIAIDYQRHVYKIDTWGWLRSLGRKPLRLALPRLTEVAVHKHLHSALRRVKVVRIADIHRQTLHDLLQRAEERSEQQLRVRLRPIITGALEEAQLVPGNTVERVAVRKLVEELIDRILDRGFLTMGDLRDAVARNELKERDLAGPKDLLFGDQLLSADKRMAAALDGVYRHGEFYLRLMQWLSSLAFGTGTGRLLMRYLILPFGGAFIAEMGVRHLVHLFHVATNARPADMPTLHMEPPPEAPPPFRWEQFAEHMQVVLLLGLFLLLLINSERFRQGLWWAMCAVGRGLRYVVSELPQQLMQLAIVRKLLASRYYRWAMRFAIKPGAITAILAWVMPHLATQWKNTPEVMGAIFLSVNLVLNSRLGRDLEEVATDWAGRLGHWLGVQVIARLFWLIMDLFRALVEATERLLYTVDEWLRFRSGEGRVTLAAKAVMGAFWFVVAYVTRFCVTLLIEPQVNPIKHFPVVTVSHKVLIPFIPSLAGVFMLAMDKELAYTTATVIITSIPGIFGFFAWELRENWRLYAANRPKSLSPVTVGKHGESMRGLLLPGLHSGTIPKRYAKLRKAESEMARKGRWSAIRKHLGVLEELHTQVRRFVQRDLLWLLNEADCWNGARIYLAGTGLATNRVWMELRLDETASSLVIEFEARKGWLLGGTSGAEVVERLSDEQRTALATAVTGLYKAAGVDLVRQDIETQLPVPTPLFDLSYKELIVLPEGYPETKIRYRLDGQEAAERETVEGPAPEQVPVLDVTRLMFRKTPLPWPSWVQTWEKLSAKRSHGEPLPVADCLPQP